jgi:hypothetical protein
MDHAPVMIMPHTRCSVDERDGFYLARSGVTITHSSEPGATH